VIGDHIAWGELSGRDDLLHVKHLSRLRSALRPISTRAQLIHGDLTGNACSRATLEAIKAALER
jgi:hypothetical protein